MKNRSAEGQAGKPLSGCSQNLAGRGQILTILPGNSHSIAQKIGEIWTDQANLQPISFKSDRLLVKRNQSNEVARSEKQPRRRSNPGAAPMRTRFRRTLGFFMLLGGWCWHACSFGDNFNAELRLGGYAIEAEIPATPQAHMRGLMYRTSLPENRGMLFAFRGGSRQCMWMRETLIPLSVAFLDAAGVILNVEEMQPRTLQAHCSHGPARYALEMNGGWFAKHGVSAGMVVSGQLLSATPR